MAMEMEMVIALEVVKRTPPAIRTVQSNRVFSLVYVQGPDGVLTKTLEISLIRFQNRSGKSEMLSVSSPYPPTGVKARETLQRIYKKRSLMFKVFCFHNRLRTNRIFFYTRYCRHR